jgi:DMSO reductase anchor subunit
MLPGDFYGVSAEHAHPPLLVMLTVTQLSAGAFFLNWIVGRFFEARAAAAFGVVSACLALALGLAAMGAGTLHLGRPQYSFRAVLGIRTSWLSREALGFLVFSGLASLFAATRLLGVFGMPWLPPALVARLGGWQSGLELGASIAGLVSVFCSVMVYAATKRAHWRGSITGFKFFMTTLILGASTLLMVSGVMSAVRPALAEQFLSRTVFGNLCAVLAAAAGLKILSDASVFLHLGDRHHHVLKRSAIIMSRELRNATQGRFICATLGGVLLPLMVMRLVHGAPQAGWIAGTTVAAFVFALGGELLERFLFFAAAPHSKMPGGLR